MKKKVTIVVVIVLVIVLIAACVMWRIGGVETESALGDHQKYVYAYVSSIEGNEVTYMEVDESVAKAAEERAKEKAKAEDGAGSDSTEQSGQMQMPPDMDSTEMPQGAPGEHRGRKQCGNYPCKLLHFSNPIRAQCAR